MKLLRLVNNENSESRFNAYIQNPIQIKKGGKIALKHLTMDVVPKDFDLLNNSIQIKVGQKSIVGDLTNDFYKYITLPDGSYSQSQILQLLQYNLNSSLDGSYYYKLSINAQPVTAGSNTIIINKSDNIFFIDDVITILYSVSNNKVNTLKTKINAIIENGDIATLTLDNNFIENGNNVNILQNSSFNIDCEDLEGGENILTLKNFDLINYIVQGAYLVFSFTVNGNANTAIRQVVNVGTIQNGTFEIDNELNVDDSTDVSLSTIVIKSPETKTDVGMQFSTSTDSSGNLVIAFNRSDEEIGTTDTTTNLKMTQTVADYFQSTVANTIDNYGSFAQFKVPACKGGFHNEIEIKSSVGGTIQPNGTRIYTQAQYCLLNSKINTNLAPVSVPFNELNLLVDYFPLPINANNFANNAFLLTCNVNLNQGGYFAENIQVGDYFVVKYTNTNGQVKKVPKEITEILYDELTNTTSITVAVMTEAGTNVEWCFMGYALQIKNQNTGNIELRLFSKKIGNLPLNIFPKSGDIISVSRRWIQTPNYNTENNGTEGDYNIASEAYSELAIQIETYTLNQNDPNGIPDIFNPLGDINETILFNSIGKQNVNSLSSRLNNSLLQDCYCSLFTAETKPNTAKTLFKISQYPDPTITNINNNYIRVHPANTQNVIHNDDLDATASLVSLYIPDLSTQQLLGFNTDLYTQNAVSGSFSAENNFVQNVVDDDVIVEITNIPFESYESSAGKKANGRKNMLYVLTRQDFNESTLNNRFDSDIQYPIFMDIGNEVTTSVNSFSVFIYKADDRQPFNLLGKRCSLVLLVEDPV
jgi:hypothetical protein